MTGSEGKVSVEFLRECFDYRDGELFWKERPAHHFKRQADHITFIKRSAGKPAGRSEPKGYMCVKLRLNGWPVCISVHRIVWAMHYGKWPEQTIDHIDRNKKNNRIENLRDVSMSVNLQNRGNPDATGFLGVTKAGARFKADTKFGTKHVYLGTFDTPEQAHDAYVRAHAAAERAAIAVVRKCQLPELIPLRVVEMADMHGKGAQ